MLSETRELLTGEPRPGAEGRGESCWSIAKLQAALEQTRSVVTVTSRDRALGQLEDEIRVIGEPLERVLQDLACLRDPAAFAPSAPRPQREQWREPDRRP